MKKMCLMAAMLALLLLAGCSTSPAEAGEAEPSPPPPSTSAPADTAEPVLSDIPAYYAAYAEIVQDYQRQYGPECIQQIYSRPDMLNYLMGVCVVRLIDFDLDGTLELMLCWPASEASYHSYCYAIWTSPDGVTAEQVCEEKILDGTQSYCPFIQLVSRTDGMFLGEDISSPYVSEAHIYRSVSPSGLSNALALGYEPYSEEEQYWVNEQAVSGDAYDKAISDFLKDAEVTQINFVLADFEDAAPLIKAIQATQEALLILGIKPNETGLDITSFEPEQTGYTPYLEIIDQYLVDYGQPQVLSSSWYDGRDDTPALGGLCVVRLSDLNGDGMEELILAYVQTLAMVGRNISYAYEIWTLRDGAAQQLIRASIPYEAYEPCMMFYAGQPESYVAINYDANTGQASSIASVEYEVRCYGYDGEALTRTESLLDIPDEVRGNETEHIYFSEYSYRWAYGMDWDTDSRQVVSKTLDTIELLRSST